MSTNCEMLSLTTKPSLKNTAQVHELEAIVEKSLTPQPTQTVSKPPSSAHTTKVRECIKKLLSSRKSPNKMYLFLYNLTMPFLVISTVASVAFYSDLPFIFPSLGPTAFLHFAIPNKAPSSPKNTLIGHSIGIMAGSLSLQLTGLYDHGVIFQEGVVFSRIFCAALSVSVTCGFMILFNVAHPPAGATTLIVSLGILKTPMQLSIMILAVLIITVEAFILNRICRKDATYPKWSAPRESRKEKRPQNTQSQFSLLRGFSSFRLSQMNIKYVSVKRKIASLTVDNFLECFEICSEIEDDQLMRILIEFAIHNCDTLNKMDDYLVNVPYGVRFAVNNFSQYV